MGAGLADNRSPHTTTTWDSTKLTISATDKSNCIQTTIIYTYPIFLTVDKISLHKSLLLLFYKPEKKRSICCSFWIKFLGFYSKPNFQFVLENRFLVKKIF